MPTLIDLTIVRMKNWQLRDFSNEKLQYSSVSNLLNRVPNCTRALQYTVHKHSWCAAFQSLIDPRKFWEKREWSIHFVSKICLQFFLNNFKIIEYIIEEKHKFYGKPAISRKGLHFTACIMHGREIVT